MRQVELPSETFVLLLEKLELSKGFLNLEKMTNKPHVSRTSLLPTKELVELIEDARNGHLEYVLEFIRTKDRPSTAVSTNQSVAKES